MDKDLLEAMDLINRRIDDNKAVIGTFISTAVSIFAILAIVFTWNLNTEKNNLTELKKELKEEVREFLGKKQFDPEIKIYRKDETPLDGSQIDSYVIYDDKTGRPIVEMPIVLVNEGRGLSENFTFKIYTDERIPLNSESVFEKGFKYENYWQGEAVGITTMPGGFSTVYLSRIWPVNRKPIEPGVYPVMIKVFYGQGKIEKVRFRVKIDQTIPPVPADSV